MTRGGTVAVAMSGGVDSSVAAALLVAQGLDVFGIMLRLWVEPGHTNRCCSPDDVSAARRVAAHLGIPFYVVDMQEPFHDVVVEPFVRAYLQGLTPNPCMECNRVIRWQYLRAEATALGADRLATGHYARTRTRGGNIELLRSPDGGKDQSYVLAFLDQPALRMAAFPVGALAKTEVRALARQHAIPTAEKSDSQDLCFLGGEDYRRFLRRHAPSAAEPGPIVDTAGTVIGQHDGLADYTIGQRKGIRVPSSRPLYVLQKDFRARTLVVGPRPQASAAPFRVMGVNWIDGTRPESRRTAEVQVRYRSPARRAEIEPVDDTVVEVRPLEPLSAVTPGQAAVFYQGEICLGGGTIAA
jgi:tRNA-specific 2-thiouridylase